MILLLLLAAETCDLAHVSAATLTTDERTTLAALAERGPVLMAVESCKTRLLPRCSARGAYRWSAVTTKRDPDRMISGARLLDRAEVSIAELEGECAGASHVVSAMALGAFRSTVAMTGAKPGATIEDGRFDACPTGETRSATPPAGCSAPTDLRLSALVPARPCPPKMERKNGLCLRTDRQVGAEGPAMIAIPGGVIDVGREGDLDAMPVHRRRVRPFSIDRLEVTVAAYRSCVQAGACPAPSTERLCNWPDKDDHPVNCIERDQAIAYCRFVGRRLPTELEWELAARGADGREFPWAGDDVPASGVCWSRSNIDGPITGGQGTCPAGASPADKSPFGVMDMAGNILEYIEDASCPYWEPSCDLHYRTYVMRGGTWPTHLIDDLRGSHRNRTANIHPILAGVRCAKSGP